MAVGPEITAAVNAVARKAMAIAKDISTDFAITGEYIDSFEVDATVTRLQTSFGSHDVATGILVNQARDEKGHPYAAAVEWGNKRNHHPHHVLGRTLAELAND